MPKKTRLQKLRNQMKMNVSAGVRTVVTQSELPPGDPAFKKDLLKSIVFAVSITLFEIALYFVYYLRIFERR